MRSANRAAVLVARQGHVMVITLNRPEVRNAVNLEVHIGVGEAMAEAAANPEVRAVLITGAGDQSFCAGADLKALANGEALVPDDPVKRRWGFAGFTRHAIDKPTIAAVNGSALGGGTEIVLSCDLSIAVEEAVFGLPEVSRGIVAGAGGAFRLVDQLPRKIALEMLLTGAPIDAARALELGLVNGLTSADRLIDTAMALAERIAANAPLAVQATKRIALGLIAGEALNEREAWERNDKECLQIMNTADAREGPRAFMERRKPSWSAR